MGALVEWGSVMLGGQEAQLADKAISWQAPSLPPRGSHSRIPALCYVSQLEGTQSMEIPASNSCSLPSSVGSWAHLGAHGLSTRTLANMKRRHAGLYLSRGFE